VCAAALCGAFAALVLGALAAGALLDPIKG